MKITGQCHCGSVSFEANVDPQKVLVCHCADCQQFSGGPFRAVLPALAQDVAITGEVKRYVKVAASGNQRAQVFCPTCGTQLYATEAQGEPKVLNIRLGCVNERAQLAPSTQIWGQSAMPWLPNLASLPLHAQGSGSPLVPGGAGRGD